MNNRKAQKIVAIALILCFTLTSIASPAMAVPYSSMAKNDYWDLDAYTDNQLVLPDSSQVVDLNHSPSADSAPTTNSIDEYYARETFTYNEDNNDLSLEGIDEKYIDRTTAAPEVYVPLKERQFFEKEYVDIDNKPISGSLDFEEQLFVAQDEVGQDITIQENTEYFSQLTEEEIELICQTYFVEETDLAILEETGKNLAESIIYAQIAYENDIDILDILDCCDTVDDVLLLNDELQKYRINIDEDIIGNELDLELKGYILDGFTVDELKSIYAVASVLGIDMEEVLSSQNSINSRNSTRVRDIGQLSDINYNQKQYIEQSNFEIFAEELGVDVNLLLEHAEDNNLSFDALEGMINHLRLSLIGKDDEDDMAIMSAPMSTSSTGNLEPVIPYDLVTAPFIYDYSSTEKINLNTGALVYETVDVTIPGINGLDLVIGRRYDSGQANIYTPTGGYISYDSYVTGYYAEVYYYSYKVVNGIETRLYQHDFGPEITGPFNSYAAARTFVLDNYPSMIWDDDLGANFYYKRVYEIFDDDIYAGIGYDYETELIPNTYYLDMYGLGQGWSFMFSSIEKIGSDQYLHLSSGGMYEIDFSSSSGYSNLKDYELADLRIVKESNQYRNSKYTLYHNDGTKEYFNSSGQLIGIKDRYDNVIDFVHTTQNSLPKITITDTLGNVIVISGTSTTAGHKMTVSLPQGSLTYNIEDMEDHNSYSIASFKNQVGQETSYLYSINTGDVNVWEQAIVIANRTRNAFADLDLIIQPTGHYTIYGYEVGEFYNFINLGDGWAKIPRVTRRYESSSNVQYNRKDYNYHEVNYTGFPDYDPEDTIPNNFTYKTTVTDTVDSVANEVTFNKDHLQTFSSAKHDNTLVSTEARQYNSYNLPSKITTQIYNPTGSGYMQSIESYEYDDKGNVTAYWSPLANGSTSASSNYKTAYIFDYRYNQLLTKTYKQDAATTIVVQNTLDDFGKNIVSQQMKVNNSAKEKTDYSYDSYGNITTEKKYADDLTNYAQINYTYANNAYLTEAKHLNVLDASGDPAAGSPGYADGTIVRKYQYDSMGRPTRTTDENNNATQYTYDYLGNITKVTYPDNSEESYARDYSVNSLTVTDVNEHSTLYTYNALGKEYEVKDLTSNTTLSRKEYNNRLQIVKETNFLTDTVTAYQYDFLGRATQKEIKYSTTSLAKETYAYHNAYTTGNNGQSRVQKTIEGDSAAPSITEVQYIDKMGHIVSAGNMVDSTEHLNTYTYDYLGNQLTEKKAYAPTEAAFTSKNEYDYKGRVVKAYNADEDFVINSYNAYGQLTESTDYAGTPTTNIYDGLGRVLETKAVIEDNEDGKEYAIKQYAYDAAGNVTESKVSNNLVGANLLWARTSNEYNSMGRLTYTTMYNGSEVDSVTAYEYDNLGNVTAITTGLSSKTATDGQVTEYAYDRFGNLISLTDALGQIESYTYGTGAMACLGLLNTKTDRKGNMTTYSYSRLGLLLVENVISGGASINHIYTYTKTGAKNSESNGTISQSYKYDALGRLIEETETGGLTKNYSYDLAGNRISFIAKLGTNTLLDTSYTYDNLNRLATVKEGNVLQASYTYTENGARESMSYANGTAEYYEYNKANWLTRLENKQGSSTISYYDYTYYADGNQAGKLDQNLVLTEYAYDGAGRLATEMDSTGFVAEYDYDRFSNRVAMEVDGAEQYSVAYSYDANNRLLTESKEEGTTETITNYGYDNNGNQIAKWKDIYAEVGTDPEALTIDGSMSESYSYDGLNRLVRTVVGGEETTYTYRTDGLRHSKESSEGSTIHLWDGSNIIADIGADDSITTYLRGVNLIMSDDGEESKYYLYNGHGDVVQLADDSGDVLWYYDYDAFGVERAIEDQDAALDANPFRYCAEYFDAETGSIYLRARYYNPTIGRFTSQDPIRDGLNWYSYCSGNPIAFVDPSGMYYVSERKKYIEPIFPNLMPSGEYTTYYVLQRDNWITLGARSVISFFAGGPAITMGIEKALGVVGGNSATGWEGVLLGSLGGGLAKSSKQTISLVGSIISGSNDTYNMITGLDILVMDKIAFELIGRNGLSTTAASPEILTARMEALYGYMLEHYYYFSSIADGVNTMYEIDTMLLNSKHTVKFFGLNYYNGIKGDLAGNYDQRRLVFEEQLQRYNTRSAEIDAQVKALWSAI